MKQTIILFSALLLASCNNKTETNSLDTKTTTEKELSEAEIQREAERVVDSAANAAEYEANVDVNGENPKVAEARKTLDEATSYVKKGIRGEMNNTDVNKKVDPLMKKYENLKKELTKTEVEKLENYRITEMNKVIDLQMQNN